MKCFIKFLPLNILNARWLQAVHYLTWKLCWEWWYQELYTQQWHEEKRSMRELLKNKTWYFSDVIGIQQQILANQ